MTNVEKGMQFVKENKDLINNVLGEDMPQDQANILSAMMAAAFNMVNGKDN